MTRRPFIRATVKARGKQFERSFPPGTSARTITDWKDRARGRLKEQEPETSRGTFTVDIDRYLDTLADRRELKKERTRQLAWWRMRLGNLKRRDITPVMIRSALAELRTVREASTCNHYRDALYAVWRTLDGRNGHNPVRDVPKFTEPESAPRDLPHGLVERILATMKDLSGPAPKGQRRRRVSLGKIRLRVIFATGLSPAEIMRIQPSDLLLAEGAVYVRRRQKGKGVDGMMLPLTEPGVKALEAFRDANAFGKFSTHGVRQSWVTACKTLAKAEATTDEERQILRHARPYDLRHTFGTHVFRKTKSLKLTQRYMRHRSDKTTTRYVRSGMPDYLRNAIDLISAVGIQPPPPQSNE